MSRSRNLKPGFFQNEDLAATGFEGQLLYAGLWTLADRRGRLEDRPLRIKAAVFPYQNVDVEHGLSCLADGLDPFIKRYEINGRRYIQIIHFEKHQNPHPREPESDIPVAPVDGKQKATVKSRVIKRPGNVIKRLGNENKRLGMEKVDMEVDPAVPLPYIPLPDVPIANTPSPSSLLPEPGKEAASPDSRQHRRMGPGVMPPAYPKPDPKVEPERALSLVFRILKHIPKEHWQRWDEDHLAEFVPQAQRLLQICGGLDRAHDCMCDLSDEWDAKKFKNWGIHGIVKSAYEWTAAHPPGRKTYGTNDRKSLSVADAGARRPEQSGGLRKVSDEEAVLARFRNLPAVRPEPGAGLRGGTDGDGESREGVQPGAVEEAVHRTEGGKPAP